MSPFISIYIQILSGPLLTQRESSGYQDLCGLCQVIGMHPLRRRSPYRGMPQASHILRIYRPLTPWVTPWLSADEAAIILLALILALLP